MNIESIQLAVDNIAKYGDTDIFPYPIEKLIFFDKRDEIIGLLQELDKNFVNEIVNNPPVNISALAPIGYTGFRWATQIDPFWNAYFLSAVIEMGEAIEKVRIKKEEGVVYSYRFCVNQEKRMLFDTDYNWLRFQRDSLDFLKNNSDYEYVVVCDIADFYNRIYHHPLENALDRLDAGNDLPKKIKNIIQKFSNTKSYGLPIGGEAARLLAELTLNNSDKLLFSHGFKFKRFVDDIHIFCRTMQEAHSALNYLAGKLMKNEGLTLQKHKTQIQTRIEFEKLVSSRINAESDDFKEKERAKFMSLPINYDPYSDNADEDYQKIKEQLDEFDIVGLLNDELKKVRIHQQFGKRLIKTFDILDSNIISRAFDSIINRFDILYPIFPEIMKSAYKHNDKLEAETRENLHKVLRQLILDDSYIIQSEINMTYLLRVLGSVSSAENEDVINKVYGKFSESLLIKSIVIQIMIRWKAYYWLADKKDAFSTMNKWERRMFIIAAHFLGDEGDHWLRFNKRTFSTSESIISEWAKEKSKISTWIMPL